MRLVGAALGAGGDARLDAALGRLFAGDQARAIAGLRRAAEELGLAGHVEVLLASGEPLAGQLADVDYLLVDRRR